MFHVLLISLTVVEKYNMIRVHAVLTLGQIFCAACREESCDPAVPVTGTIFGTTLLMDSHVQPLSDMSGVIARYVDTEGNI